jgi:hypothetical protein
MTSKCHPIASTVKERRKERKKNGSVIQMPPQMSVGKFVSVRGL